MLFGVGYCWIPFLKILVPYVLILRKRKQNNNMLYVAPFFFFEDMVCRLFVYYWYLWLAIQESWIVWTTPPLPSHPKKVLINVRKAYNWKKYWVFASHHIIKVCVARVLLPMRILILYLLYNLRRIGSFHDNFLLSFIE